MGECFWSPKSSPELLDTSRNVLATFCSGKHALRRSTPPTLSVADCALPGLDLIVLGWIVVMHDLEKGEKVTKVGEVSDIVGNVLQLAGA